MKVKSTLGSFTYKGKRRAEGEPFEISRESYVHHVRNGIGLVEVTGDGDEVAPDPELVPVDGAVGNVAGTRAGVVSKGDGASEGATPVKRGGRGSKAGDADPPSDTSGT